MTKSNHKTQVAIYARVSSKDKQDVENQLRELRSWTKKMGHKIYREYVHSESGSKGKGERQQFAQMFADARMRKFDLVLFWALDRFTRAGLAKTIYHLQRLQWHLHCVRKDAGIGMRASAG